MHFRCKTSLWSRVGPVAGGTCCGADCYEGLQFSLNPNGSLTCPLANLAGLCVASAATGPGLVFMPCGAGAAQQWTYNASTGALRNVGSSACLQSPLVPPQFYVQVRVVFLHLGIMPQASQDRRLLTKTPPPPRLWEEMHLAA